MSTLQKKLPLSVVIFDRTKRGVSDVPTFSANLRRKVNTRPGIVHADALSAGALHMLSALRAPYQQAVRDYTDLKNSALCADPVRGQTTGFAPRAESKRDKSQEIREDPTLLRTGISSKALLSFLQNQVPVPIPKVEIAKQGAILAQEHKKGLVDIVVIPQKQELWITRFEPTWYKVRRYTYLLSKKLERTPSMVHAWQERFTSLLRSLRDLKLSPNNWGEISVRFPTITIPSVQIPQISFTKVASRFMITSSIVLMLFTVGPMVVLQAQTWHQQILYAIRAIPSKATDTVPQATPTATPTPEAIPAADKQFQIQIPKLGIDSRVVANVDAGDEGAYTAALKNGVAHAAGTNLPGEVDSPTKTIFIFGHSTNATWNISRYNALFYGLKDLSAGDSVTLWFWGKQYDYTVTEKKIVAANDVSFLMPQKDKDQLILQTCFPPGTSWQRLLIIATPKKS